VLWKAEQRALDEGFGEAFLQQALQNSDLAYDLPYMLACQQRILFGRGRSVIWFERCFAFAGTSKFCLSVCCTH